MCRAPEIDVFYDGDCPVCRFEVGLYERLDRAERIRWVNVLSLSDADLPYMKSRDDLLGRFHVRDVQTEPDRACPTDWFIGVEAFARIWRVLPGFRHFAFLFDVPGIKHLAIFAYRLFLKWQGWHRRRRSNLRP
ncbi:thiol-disulfide oxidoreductase DCC family protein [Shewanella sp.]|uniref:thiol-disulfide oxidoreductase DCC family protein n=1 Tax=Shewanella sp. TaxID=50422 RepID=UPI003C778D11